jgi:hypothetical protein
MKKIFGKFMALFIIFSFVFVAAPVLAAVQAFDAYGSGAAVGYILSQVSTKIEVTGELQEASISSPPLLVDRVLSSTSIGAGISRTSPRINRSILPAGAWVDLLRPNLTYTADVTYKTVVLPAEAAQTGEVTCTHGDGTLTITDPYDGSTLVMKTAGQGCTLGSPQRLEEEIGPHTFNGTYYVLSGTGRFVGARGSGTYVVGVDKAVTLEHTLSLSGTIDY